MTNVLFIGGHGKVGLLAAPKLVDKGLEVTSLIRNPDHVSDIESLGATALVQDVTTLDANGWDKLLSGYDVVVWSAGNGGRGGQEVTYAVDRDAALAVVDSLERLAAKGTTPRYINVSYAGATQHSVPEEDSFFAYADSKKTVDDRLNSTEGLDYLILGPAALTEETSTGWAPVSTEVPREQWTTARDLVAEVITEFAGRDNLPENRTVEFIDGERPVSEI
ncbi:MAG TPA: NAD(P)H-binding protein [Candidatus Corynebacterium avicola]|uniref:NAD(P)H-binding protein n=1 Tax=Candidatus Corynebacterium avicola TaxID=2838527 RepID=A0A9D1UM38_9CORY|nr:NAD(P)H-binding protein [Candidatus Corynebacterium avicola]